MKRARNNRLFGINSQFPQIIFVRNAAQDNATRAAFVGDREQHVAVVHDLSGNGLRNHANEHDNQNHNGCPKSRNTTTKIDSLTNQNVADTHHPLHKGNSTCKRNDYELSMSGVGLRKPPKLQEDAYSYSVTYTPHTLSKIVTWRVPSNHLVPDAFDLEV
eukprot:1940115-Amphidinium_carterae.1